VLQLIARGDQVFSLGSEGRIQTWRSGQGATSSWQRQLTPVRRLALLGKGVLVTSHDDGSLRRWHGDRLAGFGYGASAGIRQLLGLQDGRILAAAASPRLSLLKPEPTSARPVNSGQQGVWSLLVRGNGEVISGGEDGSLRRWQQEVPLGAPLASGQGSVTAVLSLPNGDLLSGGRITQAGQDLGGVRRWRGLSALSGVAPLGSGPIRQLLADGGQDVLAIHDNGSSGSALLRFRLDGGVPVPLGVPEAQPPPFITSLVRLPSGELLSAGKSKGELRRWQRDASRRLRLIEVIPTGLEGIGSLTLLEGGRQLLIGSVDRRSSQEVVTFDLRSHQVVGRPVPLGKDAGWASALAVLPDRGLVIGTTKGELRWLQPRRILAAACAELPELSSASRLRSTMASDAVSPDLKRFARQACKR
jgi:hypothetical protein